MTALDGMIAAKRIELDQAGAYFAWAADSASAHAAGVCGTEASYWRGRTALNRMTARYFRECPVGRDGGGVIAWLERWERICQRRMDAEGFTPCLPGGPKHGYLFYADGIAMAARDALAVIRTGSALISDHASVTA